MSVCLQCETLPKCQDIKLQSCSLLVLGRRGATGLLDAEVLFACECFEPSRGSMGVMLLQYRRKFGSFSKRVVLRTLTLTRVFFLYSGNRLIALHKSVLLCALTGHYRSVRNKQVVAGGVNVFFTCIHIVQYNTNNVTCELIMRE